MILKKDLEIKHMEKFKLIALLTGGTGYIGYNLSLYLADLNIGVVLIKRLDGANKKVPSHKNIHIAEYNGDQYLLNELFEVHKINLVIHLASLSSKMDTIDTIRLFQKVNIELTAQILNIVKNRNDFLGFINIGSIWQLNKLNDNYNFVYTIFKQFQEDLIKFFSINYQFRSLSLLIVDSYGPYDWRPKVLNSIIDGHLELNPLLIDNPGALINLLHISDIVEGIYKSIIEVINQKEFFIRYHLASENNINLLDLSKIVELIVNDYQTSNFERFFQKSSQKDTLNINMLPGWVPKVRLIEGINEIIQIKRNK